MPILPLANRLKKKAHRTLALAQDLMVVEIYSHLNGAVIHGGTAIWRCYGSGRFSEDIDVYLPKKFRKSEEMKKFIDGLKKKGFEVKKFRERENSIFSSFSYANTTLLFEAVFLDAKNFITKPFEMSDGTFINVYTLSPEELVKEKILTYKKRKKVRDLYDIFFFLKIAENTDELKKNLREFVKNFKEPADAANLKALIIYGAVPSVKNMLEEIERWAR